MNSKGRIENSFINSVSGLLVQIISTILGLLARTVFIHTLGKEYLGINGLFSNILTILSLAELGVGSAIIYNLYKPVANKNEIQIAKLLNLYRRCYSIIGVVIAVFGIVLIPFLGYIIKEQPDIEGFTLIYILFLSNTVVSYLFAYKKALFTADQMERVISLFNLFFQVIRYGLQISVLVISRNYIIYLIIQIVCTLFENVFISIYADRKYPFLNKYKHEKIGEIEQKQIMKNVRALFIYKIGSTALDGTDNIIISAFDGVINVGLLSNYGLVTGSIQTLLNKITQALSGSVGNYIAKEEQSSREKMLNNITFMYYVLYGTCFVGSMAVLNPFVSIWAGKDYVLNEGIVFIHCLNIYIYGMMNSVWMFRATMGLFEYGKYRPLVSAVINVAVSIWWAKKIGLMGVLLGTTFTRIVTNVWFDPLIVYKYGLKKSPVKYYLRWLLYLVVCVGDIGIVFFIARLISLIGFISILLYGLLAVLIFIGSTYLLFRNSEAFQYFVFIGKQNINRLAKKR